MSVGNLLPKGKASVIFPASSLCKLKIKPSLGLGSRLPWTSAWVLWGGLPNQEPQRVRKKTILKAGRVL